MHRFARSVLSAAVLAAGLSLGLGGCNEEAAHSLMASKDLGGVSFRLSSGDSLVFSGLVDSVRIQASREGYPVHSVSGSLRGTTSLPDLEPGTWRLEIALYDSLHALRWYGDTSVEVRAGAATDVVVRLSPAKGSVNVRIVLDSTSPASPASDTLPVAYAQWDNQSNWSALKAWRTREGIYLYAVPPTCSFKPVVRLASSPLRCVTDNCVLPFLPISDSSALVLGGSSDPLKDCVYNPVALPPVTHFVPWTRRGAVTLHTSNGDVVLTDPSGQTAVDSGFTSYAYTISGFMPMATAYSLSADGAVTRAISYGKGIGTDSTAQVSSSKLHPDSLAVARSILQSNGVRHPVALGTGGGLSDSNGLTMGCPTDMPLYGRRIRYANGVNADLSWSYSNYCGTLPSGWKDLNRVDAMLQALFPVVYLDVDTSYVVVN